MDDRSQAYLVMCYRCNKPYSGTPTGITRHGFSDPIYNYFVVKQCGKTEKCQGFTIIFDYSVVSGHLPDCTSHAAMFYHGDAPQWLVDRFATMYKFRPLQSHRLSLQEHALVISWGNWVDKFNTIEEFIRLL